MLIGKNYKIESDDCNVVLSHRRVSGEGVERWKTLTYHNTLKDALKALVELEVGKTKLVDFQTVVDKMDELYKLIKGVK